MERIKIVTIFLMFTPFFLCAQNQYLAPDVEEAIISINDDYQNIELLGKQFEDLRSKYLKVSEEKKDFNFYLNLGAIYASGKLMFSDFNSVDSAIYYLAKAKKLNPLIPETYNQLGFLYWGIGNPLLSIEYFKKALKYDITNEYIFCYEGIVSAYAIMRNPHMVVLYSKFLEPTRLEENSVLQEIIAGSERIMENNYPIEVKIDSAQLISYKNKKTKFSVKYPHSWNETNDIPYDSARNESYLNLALEEILDKNNEYTLSGISLIANDGDISYDDFVVKTLAQFNSNGKATTNQRKILANTHEFQTINGKYIDTLIFTKGETFKYVIIYSTTSGAYDLDLDKFKLFLENCELNG